MNIAETMDDVPQLDYTYCVENETVRLYLSGTDYSTEYSYSVIHSFISDDSGCWRQDWPKPLEITLDSALSYTPSHFIVLNVTNEHIILDKYLPNDSNSILVYNLTPGSFYHYRIESEDFNIIQKGVIEPTGMVRMINAGYLGNIRDLGGWRTEGGQMLRYNRVFRGGEIDGLHDQSYPQIEDLNSLINLGVSVEIDLRGDYSPSPFGDAVKYIPLRLGNYTTIANSKQFADAIRTIIHELQSNNIIYIHCWGGADRTGVLCTIIEGICGVTEDELSKDYELTSFSKYGLRERTNRFIDAINYIKQFEGNTLQEKFKKYIHSGGLTYDEIQVLINELVEKVEISTGITAVSL